MNLDKFLHNLYLTNYTAASNSFGLEKLLFKSVPPSSKNILITGLARAGTTALLNHLYASNQFASLTYRDMPFLLMPNVWGKRNRSVNSKKIRLHDDGLTISNDSPEALDEFFWKVSMKDSFYKSDSLSCHQPSEQQLKNFKRYIDLICNAYQKKMYLSKNNNSILRMQSLIEFKIFDKIFVLFRNPLDHASSLLKLNIKFSEDQKKDPYILEYFNFLGHHEFGLNHLPFLLYEEYFDRMKSEDKFSLNYWLLTWSNYYKYILNHFIGKIYLVEFKEICERPLDVVNFITRDLCKSIEIKGLESFKALSYTHSGYNPLILEECMLIYENLKSNACI